VVPVTWLLVVVGVLALVQVACWLALVALARGLKAQALEAALMSGPAPEPPPPDPAQVPARLPKSPPSRTMAESRPLPDPAPILTTAFGKLMGRRT